MEPKSLAARLGEVEVLDVREDFEWEAGRIEGSIHIPMKELAARVGEVGRQGPVVAVCFAGGRSAYAARFLQSQGFEALNLNGGLKSWVGLGLPLVAEGGAPGNLVHDPPANPLPASEAPQAQTSEAVAEPGGLPYAGELSAAAEPGGMAHAGELSAAAEPGGMAHAGELSAAAEPGGMAHAGESERLSDEMESLKDAFIEVVFAAQERFGEEEPPEEEMRAFMKEWLVSKGKSPQEADDLLGD